jgi:MFS family permease
MSQPSAVQMRENVQPALDETDKAGPQSTVAPISDVTSNTPDRGYSRLSMISMVVFSGLAIGSDGFNASIIGNLELIMGVIYPESLTTAVAARLSNAFMVGMIVGMLSFGYISDKLGRKTGAVLTTILLVLGIALSSGASGITENGMFWMLIIARGVAGVGAGGLVSNFQLELIANLLTVKKKRISCRWGWRS